MLKSQHFILLMMMIILAITLLTFILTYSLLPPKEQIPHRSRVVVAEYSAYCQPGACLRPGSHFRCQIRHY